MKIIETIKNNAKLYMILSIIILLGTIGISFALVISNFNAIAINTNMLEINADISYDTNSNGEEVVSNGNMLPINDSLVTGPDVTDSRVLKTTFNVTGDSNNPENTIYDIALHNINVGCDLRTKDLKWRLYKGNELISNPNASLSPTFDTMNNNRLVLTETQEDLTTSTDKYTFLLWISENCPGNITECTSSQDQSKYLGKEFSASIKVELSTKSKKRIDRITGSEGSCDYTPVEIPACNILTYNGNSQTLINADSTVYTLENTTGINAGTYKITAKLNDECKWSNGETNDKVLTCNIDKKDVTVTTLNQTITYGNKISSSVNNISSSDLLTSDSIETVSLESDTVDVGTGRISTSNVKIINSNNTDVTSNYNIIKKNTGSVTINCANIAVEPNVGNVMFTGEELTGVTGGSYITITGSKVGTEAGSYKVVAKPNKNYCWSDGTTSEKEYTWNIEHGEFEVVLDNEEANIVGTEVLYGRNQTGIYLDNNYKNKMSSTSNPIALPSKTGYTFDGYYTEENGNGTLVINKDGYLVSDVSSEISVLYAKWNANTYVVTYNSNNLLYGLDDVETTRSDNMEYSVHDKVVTVTALADDGFGFTNGRVYLEAGTKYIFNCDTNAITWGTGIDSVEGFLMLNGEYYTYYHLGSNKNWEFTPEISGEYWLRLDVNKSGKSYTFSNISISTVVEQREVRYGEKYGELPTISRTGYTFKGWYQESNGTGTAITSATTVPARDVTLYAKWAASTNTAYQIQHYQMQLDGTYPLTETENKTGTTNNTLTLSNLAKNYAGFTYIYGQVNGTDVTTTTIAADGSRIIKLYYMRNQYTVTLTKGTGISSVSGAGNYYYGASVTIDATASSGYTWSNWSGTHSTTTKKYTFTMPASNVTDTANTTINTYTISYNANGGSGAPAAQTKTHDINLTLSSTTPTRTGYTFLGWSTNSSATTASYSAGGNYTENGNVTLYAVWSVNSYYFDLNWTLNGSNFAGTGDTTAGLKINGVDQGYLSDYYKKIPYGSTWEIYGIKLNGTSISYSASGTLGASEAVHAININTVSFAVNNSSYGSVSTSSLYVKSGTTYLTNGATLTLNDGRKITASTKSATGYTTSFSSWSSASGTINSAISITANFSRSANLYYLDLNGVLDGASNGSIGGYGTADVYINGTLVANDVSDYYSQHPYGSTYKITDIKATTGHTYNGVYSGSLEGTIGTSTVNVVLKFTTNTYTISYNANGGSGAPSSQTKTYGQTLKLSTTVPTRANYTFLGWSTSSSATSATYPAGGNYTANSGTTLYAVWKIETVTLYIGATTNMNCRATPSQYGALVLQLSCNNTPTPVEVSTVVTDYYRYYPAGNCYLSDGYLFDSFVGCW